jgi:hypothetical protein
VETFASLHREGAQASEKMSKGEASEFYHSAAWRKARRKVVLAAGLGGVPGIIVDHRIRLERAPHLALDPANLRPMSRGDHNRRHAADRDPSKGGASLDGRPLGPAHPWNARR